MKLIFLSPDQGFVDITGLIPDGDIMENILSNGNAWNHIVNELAETLLSLPNEVVYPNL